MSCEIKKENDFVIGVIEEASLSDVADIKLPDPTLLDYYIRRKNRCILWNAEIEDGFVEIYQDILNWNREDKEKNIPVEERKPIRIYINSDGGSVSAVFAIIDLISISQTPVITIGLGKCYSSGGLLLMSGHERLLLPSCTVLIHDGQTGAFGAVGKMLDSLDHTKAVEERMKNYILKKTKISSEEYDKNYRKDWWLFADEAISYGIADRIITDINEII